MSPGLEVPEYPQGCLSGTIPGSLKMLPKVMAVIKDFLNWAGVGGTGWWVGILPS